LQLYWLQDQDFNMLSRNLLFTILNLPFIFYEVANFSKVGNFYEENYLLLIILLRAKHTDFQRLLFIRVNLCTEPVEVSVANPILPQAETDF
jgi:hypothetical protein